MEKFIVQTMTAAHYHNMRVGSNNYYIKEVEIIANNKADAIEIAKLFYEVVNEKSVISKAEALEREQNNRARMQEYQQQLQLKKEQKIQRDLARGITPEKRKAINNANSHKSKANSIRNQIAELEKDLQYHLEKQAYWENVSMGQ